MKTFLRSALKKLMGAEADEWGSEATRPSSGVRLIVEVRPDEKRLRIGELSFEGNAYVFRYLPEFKAMPGATPIPGFPDLGREYRDEDLFPFFKVRLPPRERTDVQEAMSRLSIREDDTLRFLGQVAKKTISSPYEFELAETG